MTATTLTREVIDRALARPEEDAFVTVAVETAAARALGAFPSRASLTNWLNTQSIDQLRVEYVEDDDGWDFERIAWRKARGKVWGPREHDVRPMCAYPDTGYHRSCTNRVAQAGDICDAHGAAPWQRRLMCRACSRRPVADNGKYCVRCVVEAHRDMASPHAKDILECLAQSHERHVPPPREYDRTEFIDAAAELPVSGKRYERAAALVRDTKRRHPYGIVSTGDEAFIPVFSDRGRWVVFRCERVWEPMVDYRTGEPLRKRSGERRMRTRFIPNQFVEMAGPTATSEWAGMNQAWDAALSWSSEIRRQWELEDRPNRFGDERSDDDLARVDLDT